MKAEVSQQRLLLEVAEVDAALTRLTHRSTHLVEQQRFDAVQAEHREANDRLAARTAQPTALYSISAWNSTR